MFEMTKVLQRNKQNNLSEKKLEINNLPNIIPTLSTDTLIPDLK